MSSNLCPQSYSFNATQLVQHVGGSQELMTTLLKQALQYIPQELQNLRALAKQGDWVECTKVAHKLRGTSLNMCFGSMAEHATNLEGLIQDQVDQKKLALDEVQNSLKVMESEWVSLEEVLQKLVGKQY